MLILDSSFLVAFHNRNDVHHPAASRIMERFLDGEWGDGLLAEYVFLEVVTVLAARLDIATAVTTGELLLDAVELEFVPCSAIFRGGWQTFAAQQNLSLSFVDATLVALARERNAPHLATFDRGFDGVRGVIPVGE